MRPRIRTVKPEMRQDERYARLSYPARELFNGMITMADDEGRFRAPSSAILGHVFPYDDDAPRKLRGWVAEVQASGMILFYVVDGVPYGAFRHWKRHQRINRPNPSDLPPPPDRDVVGENSVEDHGNGSVSSLNDHGSITPSRAGARSDPDPLGRLAEERQAQQVCVHLAAHICRNDPKADPNHQSVRWVREMRLLIEERGGDVAEVMRVVDWCQSDPFWHSNILSPAKLRKQFTQLVLKAKPNGQVIPIGRRESASDLINAMRGTP